MSETVVSLDAMRPQVLEFFAGIGLARMGLERAGFRVSWGNDYEVAKHKMYANHFKDETRGHQHSFFAGDVHDVPVESIPTNAEVAWASSPCTDLSLAGARRGLRSGESNAFWGFIDTLTQLDDHRPRTVVLENVVGLATSHGGDDLAAAIRAFNVLGYSADVLTIDARRFVPQSRPRLFVVATSEPPKEDDAFASELRPIWLQGVHNDPTLTTHRAPLPELPRMLAAGFGEVVENMPENDSRWWDDERTKRFSESLSPLQTDRIRSMRRTSGVKYRTAYRRTRNGLAVWEVRQDDIAGCLRTARGGSSKQAVVKLGNGHMKVRWMTALEYARLMGAGDYNFSNVRTNQALFGFGDAVAVPVVEWLAKHYLMPLCKGTFRATSPHEVASSVK